MRLISCVLLALSCGCGATSYGVNSNGVFPPRPAGADYPNWEHQCVVVTKSGASDTLNSSGRQGWELVGLAQQNGNDLMCFKRAKAVGRAADTRSAP